MIQTHKIMDIVEPNDQGLTLRMIISKIMPMLRKA